MTISLHSFVASDFRVFTRIAPLGFAAILRVRDGRPSHIENRYSESWQAHYRKKSYLLRDPLIFWALANNGVICWDDPEIVDGAGVIADARDHGLIYGITVATGCDRIRSTCGLVRSDRHFTAQERADALAALEELHEEPAVSVALTEAQLEALRLMAAGERHTRAAAMLNISESALKARLRSARDSLAARTTAGAVHAAKARGLI